MSEPLETKIAGIEKRIVRIETVFWVAAAVAAIFGITGAFGYAIVQGAKDEIQNLQNDIEPLRTFVDNAEGFVGNAKDEISAAGTSGVAELETEIDQMARDAINRFRSGRLAYARTGSHIQSLGKHTSIGLSAEAGDLVHVTYTGTAQASDFYFRIVTTGGSATAMIDTTQLIRNLDQKWQPIATQGVFRVDAAGDLKFAIEFFKSDIRGSVRVYGSSLVAVNIGNNGGQ